MPTISLYPYAVVNRDADESPLILGSRDVPILVTYTQLLHLQKTIAVSTTWDVWESGAEEPITDFDLLWITSDLTGTLVELTTDKNASFGTEVYTIPLLAGVPFILGGDDSYANYTADFGGGTLDVIDRIRIRNVSASTTTKVEVLGVT